MKITTDNPWWCKDNDSVISTSFNNLWINQMTDTILWQENDNTLTIKNKGLHLDTCQKIAEIKKEREKQWYIDYSSYQMNQLREKFLQILKSVDESIQTMDDIELTFVDRNKFDADLCIKIPGLLQKFKWQWYVKDIIPQMIHILNESSLKSEGIISKIETVGIYINITLTDNYLFHTLQDVFNKWTQYWENDTHKWESILIDYSSPNVAKHLHAWHIRSTIIGHVLSNLYNANGYFTHRVNHINDWGWFWFLIEGFIRWKDILTNFDTQNDMLFFIYTTYRKWEKAASSKDEYDKLFESDLSELKKYYWEFFSYNDFFLLFNHFVESGKNRFHSLEKWQKQEVEIWEQMVDWSMQDFNKFYDLLAIHQDYLIWESFYWDFWVKLVLELEKEWKVVLYTQQKANVDINNLEELLSQEILTQKVFETTKQEILNDVWAYVIPLDNFERFVVLKADKSSIYATRDLWAIKYRADNFSPSRIIYEVWQEQSEHFDKLFKSAEKIWIQWINFTHVYHWFYVDSKTKKKLSSRDGASNVQKLINESILFFREKYKDSNFPIEEIQDIAYKLAIWSIIFNDIRSDKKNPVLISTQIKETCESFEEAWWAYVMYSIVRANSILAKINNLDAITFENIHTYKLDNIEKIIINEINRYPLIVKQAQENDNPATLVDFLLNLSRYYNSYYNSHRVIDGEKIIDTRVLITKAFIKVASNAMSICNIQVPNRI